MVGMDPFMDLAKNTGHVAELKRLSDLNAVFFDALNGQFVQAPLDLKTSGKRILDSGTADGIWLRDVRAAAPAEHEYFGSDVEPELFPKDPDGIKYFQHSFRDPWPAELRGTFDLVHIRGSLAASSPMKPIEVVKNLATLLKPGGWIQLMEMNGFKAPTGGPAMNDFWKVGREAWHGIGVGDYANHLKDFLTELGLKNVQEKRILCELGKTAKPELFERSINAVTQPSIGIVAVAKTVPSSFTHEQLDAIPGRMRAELEKEGGRIEEVIAWGQLA
ncbi:methyltransferase [Diaporthe eres]|uniref:Methyltransferase SirN-like protein n=1 Tax=Diaporthe vaccinii TaxID=105482 RepID=A0ABR4ECU1_9PEZI|nr:methyltransferase [Diaporthe eres]